MDIWPKIDYGKDQIPEEWKHLFEYKPMDGIGRFEILMELYNAMLREEILPPGDPRMVAAARTALIVPGLPAMTKSRADQMIDVVRAKMKAELEREE